jgi:DNA-binding NtrC family response regulator
MAGGGPNAQTTVLLVEDDEILRMGMSAQLVARGFRVIEAGSREAAMQSLGERPDVVVSDLRLPDGEAIELMASVKALHPTLPVVIMTGHGTIDLAVRAVKLGAEDFLTKPIDADRLATLVQRVIKGGRPARSGPRLRAARPEFRPRSEAMLRLEEQIERLRDATCSVLLLGETGTGKSVLARRIHGIGARREGPFVDVNCPGLAKDLVESELFGHERGAFTGAHASRAGLFEAADGGTLFLDEVGDIDLHVQPKLLKALEEKRFRRMGDTRERTVDVRLIAATHHDLMASVSAGRFRADLYYRINTVTVTVPPLRDRREDIIPLAEYLLAELGEPGTQLEESARQVLLSHPWLGNLREMRNVIERVLVHQRGATVRAEDLSFDRPSEPSLRVQPAARDRGSVRRLSDIEREQIELALDEVGGRVEAAAQRLGIPRSTLYQRIREMGIRPSRPRVPVAKPGGGTS